MNSKGLLLLAAGPAWSELVPASTDGFPTQVLSCWINHKYQVLVCRTQAFAPGWPRMVHLSIKRLDKQPIHDWRDLQRIKNELCGTDAEGCEVYPAEDRLVDEANQFHIWVMEPGARLPFGHHAGRVVADGPGGIDTSTGKPYKQRPFEDHHTSAGCSPSGKISWSDVPGPSA